MKEQAPLLGLRILLVDDEEELREIFAEELTFLGAEVQTASHSREALGLLLTASSFDVVLSDLRMPDGDGMSFLRAIRAKFGGTTPLFVLMTGFTEMAPERAEAEGVARIFEKPLDWEAVINFLNEKRKLITKN